MRVGSRSEIAVVTDATSLVIVVVVVVAVVVVQRHRHPRAFDGRRNRSASVLVNVLVVLLAGLVPIVVGAVRT